MKTKRTHDDLYLAEDRKHKPKEYFKFIREETDNFLKQFKTPRILDIGCATGEFLYYLHDCYPHANLTGIDILPTLLSKAKENLPTVKFLCADIYEGDELSSEFNRYDAVFMNGVHSIFDNNKQCIDRVLKLVNFENNGRAFIFGLFNPENIDVLVKVKRIEESSSWEPGWNCFSKQGILNYLHSKNLKGSFNDFHINIDIEKKPEDPLRSWTIKLDEGQRMIVHGSQIIHHLSLLTVQK